MKETNNYLEKLFPELLDGVEYKNIGECCEIFTGGEPPSDFIKSKVPEGDYKYPIYSNGLEANALYGFAKTFRINKDAVTFSSIGTIGHPTIRKANFIPIIRLKVIIPINSKELSLSFLKYALEIAEFSNNKSSLPNINANMLKTIEIPVPPLAVQEEIVRILDKYTQLEIELEQKLGEELVLRKKQYEYYRDKLLTFDDSVEWKTLGEYFSRIKGTPITASQMKQIGNENGEIKIFAGGKTVVNAYEKDIPNAKITRVPAVLVQSRGLIDFIYYDKPFTFKNEMWAYTFENKITVKFLYYILKKDVEYFRKKTESMGAFPQISLPDTEKYKIPVPPLSEQERIVSILDKFETLCNDLTTGLPAEISARKKQYEYYRDKLLTFKRKA